jgi:hypothetical protein
MLIPSASRDIFFHDHGALSYFIVTIWGVLRVL